MREVWWCEEHDFSLWIEGGTICIARSVGVVKGPCHMVPMLLVPPGSLVISKENGEWPILCGELSLSRLSCVLPPTLEAHYAGHESEYVDHGRAVWATGNPWWRRLDALAEGLTVGADE